MKSLTRELQIAKAQLGALMNLQPGTEYTLALALREAALAPVPGTLDDQIDAALHNRPELRQAGYEERINKRELDAKILSMFPDLKVFAGINTDSNGFLFNHNWAQYGAHSAFNLINVFRIGAEKKAVRAQGDLLHEKELATAMAVMTQVQVARARFQLYGSELDTARHQYAVQAKIMGQIEGGFKAGSVSEQTALRERMNTLVSEVRYDIAFADAQNAYANLYASMGVDAWTPPTGGMPGGIHAMADALHQQWSRREVASIGAGEH